MKGKLGFEKRADGSVVIMCECGLDYTITALEMTLQPGHAHAAYPDHGPCRIPYAAYGWKRTAEQMEH